MYDTHGLAWRTQIARNVFPKSYLRFFSPIQYNGARQHNHEAELLLRRQFRSHFSPPPPSISLFLYSGLRILNSSSQQFCEAKISIFRFAEQPNLETQLKVLSLE